MKKTITQKCGLLLALALFSFYAQAQTFEKANNRLVTPGFHSGCAVAIVDVNGDGLDDIVRLADGHDLYIEYQKTGTQFVKYHIADFDASGGSAWGMCVADVDHNGIKDVMAGGGSGFQIKIIKLTADGHAMLGAMTTIPNTNFLMQNANFMDVNNDGWEDIFACDDNAQSHIYTNQGNGSFLESSIINFDVSPTDDSGNYGSVWTDFDNDGDLDLYIAKCRQGVQDNTDERRINVLFVNNGNGTYSEMGATYGLRIGAQSWTANFADIDNDGDLDCLVTNHDVDSQILENDGSGHYTDITATTGLDLSDITSIESVMEDFDNDGFVDILVTGDDARYFHNNGNKTFTKISNLFDNNAMESFAIGDLNHDGFMDIYASYAGIYTTPDPSVNDMIWLNKGNTNNFVTVDLKGTTSNEGALGARVEIYGAWGKQIREVHAGESYGTCNTSSCHFGLGTATAIDSIVVRWPSGNITHIANPKANQFVKVIESQCVSADNVITSNTNSFTFCSGQSLTLNAPAGHSYLWSDASVGQSISISTTGEYNVTISDALSLCPVTSATVKPSLNPDETPSVVVSGKLSFCQGGSVTLTSSQANSYLWSNGDATQSITVTQPNSYSLTVQGVCQQFTSTPIVVNVLAAPIPTAQGASLVGPGSVTLTAAGNSLSWFTQSLGGTAVGTGTNYVTPYLTSPTTFYVQDAYSYGGGTVSTGQKNHQGTSLYSGTNNFNETILFNVIQPCTLQSVKVYTDTYGGRIIELRNASGTVLQSHSVDISADSTVVPLNFVLTPGTNYQIGTNEAKNMISFGFASPRFQRSASANYPYLADSALTLTSSSQGSNYYYYFYDWKVEKAPTVCESERVPVLADIVLGVSSVANTEGINLFPNPTNDKLYIRSDKSVSSLVSIDITDVSGRVINHIALNTLVANNTETIDVSNIASGVYFVKIKTANSQLVERVVVR